MKYYISNDIMFLGGNGKMVHSPSSAIHYKLSGIPKTTKSACELVPVRLYNNKNHKDYALVTPMKFIGADGVVDDIREARVFDSIEAAKKYADENNVYSVIKDAIVLDSSYKKTNIKGSECYAASTRQLTVEQSEVVAQEELPEQRPEYISVPRIKFGQDLRARIYSKYNGICQICGKPVPRGVVSIDHIVPLSRGGTNDESNLQLAHDFCNQMKGSYTYDECIGFSADMMSRYLLNNPDRDLINKLARSIVRGINKKGMMASA